MTFNHNVTHTPLDYTAFINHSYYTVYCTLSSHSSAQLSDYGLPSHSEQYRSGHVADDLHSQSANWRKTPSQPSQPITWLILTKVLTKHNYNQPTTKKPKQNLQHMHKLNEI